MSAQQQYDKAAECRLTSRRRFLLGLVTAGLAYSAPTLLGLDEARAYSPYTRRSPRSRHSRHTYRSPRSRHSYHGYGRGGYQGGGYQQGGGEYRGGFAPSHGGGFRPN